ncbi:MAG: SDR family NAD(P)-dependent oxidoreductase [Ilumatobacteraceae bacterium]
MRMSRVLVTGAGSGIGEGIATVLAERGWRVAVNDIDAVAANSVADRLGGVAVVGDVAADPAGIVDRAATLLGGLDALVNNAGIHRRAPLATVRPDQLDDVYGVNLRAVVLASQAALADFAQNRQHDRASDRPSDRGEAGAGCIVNLSSIAAVTPQMDVGLYTATKAGVSAFTQQASVEWGPLGVRVNAVAPGMTRTAMAEVVYADPVLHERRRSMVPVGRIGTPRDIGTAVAFLVSDDASYVSGQTLVVDGGFTNTLIGLLPHPEPNS